MRPAKPATVVAVLGVTVVVLATALWPTISESMLDASQAHRAVSAGATAPVVPAPSAPPRSHAHGVAAARAQAALTAFDRAFYVAHGRQAHFADSTAGRHAVFWRQAEMIEMTEDAYQSTGDPLYKGQIVALMRGVVSSYSRTWTKRTWNDDILWMIIASVRAYELTGDTQYLTMARRNFDTVYARAWTPAFGGGLLWRPELTDKNATTNAPAAIAACKLATALHAPAYLAKAKRLYAWTRQHLYDARSGAVYDTVSTPAGGSGAHVNQLQLTYNQGTFIGAADLLYQATRSRAYYDDALRTLAHTKASLAPGGVLPREIGGANANGGGFKGIFCRWALKFTRDNHVGSFDSWFLQNADAAWGQRNARGLIGPDWAVPTGSGVNYSWGASAAVVLLQASSAT